jgi:uncharacterized protein (DUF697 family)
MSSRRPTPRKKEDASTRGERLLSAVERLVEDPADLIAHVETLKSANGSIADEDERVEAIARQIIDDHSRRAAIAGGITAMPGLLPGGGSLVTLVGGVLADMTFVLKYEVEMILCLSYLYDYDIRADKERWLAYVLAGLRTYGAQDDRNYLTDLLEIQLDTLPKYTPRELFKLAATVLGKIALVKVSRGFVKALPFVGIAVSASTNKFMTSSLGWTCVEALERRRNAEREEGPEAVDAFVR